MAIAASRGTDASAARSWNGFHTGLWATVDGPGVRVVAWTAGCQCRCQYCHNPDTWTMTNGIPVSVTRAVEQLRKYRQALKVMSGDLTISGGEPLMQHRFVMKLFAAARGVGIHTALDTNGYFGQRLTDADLDTVSLVLLDLKTFDSTKHKHLTGLDNAPTLAFARRLAAHGTPVWVRYVLVPGVTDDPEDIAKTADFAGSLGNVQRVDVLPFHQLGSYKCERLGLEYTLRDTQPPSDDLIERTCAAFRQAGLTAH